ncbi:hypothetical protein ES703_92316 [subsurface metagenome]
MEKIREVGEKIKKKGTDSFLDVVGELLGSIDAFDQIAELIKTVVPMKAEITVKGVKAVEIRALIRNGELWVGFRQLKKPDEEAKEETAGCDYCSEE